jgi:hypothetical protein
MGARLGDRDDMARRLSVAAAAEWLRRRHNEEKARRFARVEQRKARKMRSRKGFHFWAAVIAELESGDGDAADRAGE